MLKNCTPVLATFFTQSCHAENSIVAGADLSDKRVELIEKTTEEKFYKIDKT